MTPRTSRVSPRDASGMPSLGADGRVADECRVKVEDRRQHRVLDGHRQSGAERRTGAAGVELLIARAEGRRGGCHEDHAPRATKGGFHHSRRSDEGMKGLGSSSARSHWASAPPRVTLMTRAAGRELLQHLTADAAGRRGLVGHRWQPRRAVNDRSAARHRRAHRHALGAECRAGYAAFSTLQPAISRRRRQQCRTDAELRVRRIGVFHRGEGRGAQRIARSIGRPCRHGSISWEETMCPVRGTRHQATRRRSRRDRKKFGRTPRSHRPHARADASTGRILAGMVGRRRRRIVAVVGGDEQQVVLA